MKKYIILSNWIEKYLALEHYFFAKYLENFGWKIIKLNKFKRNNNLLLDKDKNFILFFTYDGYNIGNYKSKINNNTTIIYKLDDLYPKKNIRKQCILNADIIIGPYQYLYNKVYPVIKSKKTFHIPYSAVNNFYNDILFNENPIKKIFVSGACSKDIYPFRHFIKNEKIFEKYIEKLEHPGYSNFRHKCINKNYYLKLNSFLCCFVDASAYKYILLKVFETCSVGSLLLVCESIKDELNKLGFYNNKNCIMCNKNNVLEKMEWIFDNEIKVNEIRKNGMIFVRENHNTKKRAELFNTHITNLI